jgi:hypothetical protein
MGTCCSLPEAHLDQTLEPVPVPVPVPEPVSAPVKPRSMNHQQLFWATPVFVYNRTLPSDGYTYVPVHPVEPFHVQRYAVQQS